MYIMLHSIYMTIRTYTVQYMRMCASMCIQYVHVCVYLVRSICVCIQYTCIQCGSSTQYMCVTHNAVLRVLQNPVNLDYNLRLDKNLVVNLDNPRLDYSHGILRNLVRSRHTWVQSRTCELDCIIARISNRCKSSRDLV